MDSNAQPPEVKTGKKDRSGKTLLGFLLRFLLVLAAGAVIGAAVYFSSAGWIPYLEQRIFEPIESNQSQIQDLRQTQNALENQLSSLQSALAESELVKYQDLASTLTAMESEMALAAGKDAILEEKIDSLIAQSYTQIPALVATINANQQKSDQHIAALATAQMGYSQSRFEINLVRVMSLLSRANQFLLHDNYGLAEKDLVTAYDILLELDETQPGRQPNQLPELIRLIEEAADDLPARPSLAKGKVDLAWELIMLGLDSQTGAELQATPSPTIFEPNTPTPTPN